MSYRQLAHQNPVAREGRALGRALVGQLALVDVPERPREGSPMRALDNRWKHIRLYFCGCVPSLVMPHLTLMMPVHVNFFIPVRAQEGNE